MLTCTATWLERWTSAVELPTPVKSRMAASVSEGYCFSRVEDLILNQQQSRQQGQLINTTVAPTETLTSMAGRLWEGSAS